MISEVFKGMADSSVREPKAKENFHFMQGRKMFNPFQLELTRSLRSDRMHKEFQASQGKRRKPCLKKS